jgi:micrococcal nuclease
LRGPSAKRYLPHVAEDTSWQHPWLRVTLLLRSMLETRWDAATWRIIRTEIPKALAAKAAIQREGWFNVLVLSLCSLTLATSAVAHPGGTDGCGGHRDRAQGDYHVHDQAKACACYPTACRSAQAAPTPGSTLEPDQARPAAPDAGVASPLSRDEAVRLSTGLLAGRVWIAHAIVVRVIDGDTVVLDLDLGWNTWRRDEHVRLAGVDTPERGTSAWGTAKAFVERLLPNGTDVLLISERLSEKYGRTVGRIILRDGRDVGAELIREGLAKPYFGGTKQ